MATGTGVYPAGWADGGGEQQWTVHTGSTPSGATGPADASSAPNYMYCEASSASPGDTYKLNTATYASAGLSGLAFDLSRVGAGIGTLDVLMGDGVPAFGGEQVLNGPIGSPTGTDGAFSVYATDLDGDGDADVLSASFGDNKVAWYENQGRFPTLLGSYTGFAPGDWNLETLPLPTPLPLSGNVQFQFVYTRGSGLAGDLAIDNFCIY